MESATAAVAIARQATASNQGRSDTETPAAARHDKVEVIIPRVKRVLGDSGMRSSCFRVLPTVVGKRHRCREARRENPSNGRRCRFGIENPVRGEAANEHVYNEHVYNEHGINVDADAADDRMVPEQGLEPRFRGPEPRVLPLHHPGVWVLLWVSWLVQQVRPGHDAVRHPGL